MTGAVGQKRVTTTYLKNCDIPLAPKIQQKKIVAEIEKQFSRLDEAVENLQRVKANLKRYKASVLKAAVEGKLTEQWRAEHPDVEPANQLLERILKERRKKWEEAELAKMKAKGKVPKGDNWKAKHEQTNPGNEAGLVDLPKNWKWVQLHLVADVIDPQPSHRTPPTAKKGVPYVGMGDVDSQGLIKTSLARLVSKDVLKEHKKRYLLDEGDFIFGKIGTIGRPVLLPKPYNYTLSANVVLIQPRKEYLIPEFAFLYMGSPLLDRIILKESQATTQAAFGIKKIRIIPIPLPPLEEQIEIAKESQKIMSVIDALNRETDRGLKRAGRLRQSILKNAFSGKLIKDG